MGFPVSVPCCVLTFFEMLDFDNSKPHLPDISQSRRTISVKRGRILEVLNLAEITQQ